MRDVRYVIVVLQNNTTNTEKSLELRSAGVLSVAETMEEAEQVAAGFIRQYPTYRIYIARLVGEAVLSNPPVTIKPVK